jgi:hypothetical protein
MNPNSISHRLFVAALANGGSVPAKRPAPRVAVKSSPKGNPAKSSAAAVRQLSDWSWSGWQHPTI